MRWDTNTEYAKNFEIDSKKVTKINANRDWSQVTSVQKLAKSTISSFNFRVEQYGEKGSYMTIGIATESKKKEKDCDGD